MEEKDAVSEDPSLKAYHEYLSYLFRSLPELTPDQLQSRQYRDHLQIPLEPLKDNLESQTYEIFERDSAKYEAYSAAIYGAIADAPYGPHGSKLIIMVVGAGTKSVNDQKVFLD